MLKQICQFSGIMDSYQAYEDGDLTRNELIELCQEKVDTHKTGDPQRDKYAKWLGI